MSFALTVILGLSTLAVPRALAIQKGHVLGADAPLQNVGIFLIHDCTSIAVSSNTLLTAAHCTSIRRRNVCLGSGSSLCTTDVHEAPTYLAGRDSGADVAAAIFPDGTFPVFAAMYDPTIPLAVGRGVVMAGFADDRDTGAAAPWGRWGRNTIQKIETGTQFVRTRFGDSADAVMTYAGDSGGPLLVDCQLAGISQSNGINFLEDYLFSCHSNLSRADLRSFLQSVRTSGGEICGLDGNAVASRCPSAGKLRVRQSTGPNDGAFPCSNAAVSP